MSEIELHHVDAFTAAPFAGNPAAVCLLDEPAAPGWMQRLAAEMNLSETAFVSPADGAESAADDAGERAFDLRWFTPAMEVALCGHATLASAHVLWETGRLDGAAAVRFRTRDHVLTCRRGDGGIDMDFPAVALEATTLPPHVLAAIGAAPRAVFATTGSGEGNVLLELDDESAVRRARPDVRQLAATLPAGVIVTAPGGGGNGANAPDFVSRYFAPYYGVDEDPVTGSTHCALGPYWAERLGRSELVGFQASSRGGRVGVRVDGDRVTLSGQAVTVYVARLRALDA